MILWKNLSIISEEIVWFGNFFTFSIKMAVQLLGIVEIIFQHNFNVRLNRHYYISFVYLVFQNYFFFFLMPKNLYFFLQSFLIICLIFKDSLLSVVSPSSTAQNIIHFWHFHLWKLLRRSLFLKSVLRCTTKLNFVS